LTGVFQLWPPIGSPTNRTTKREEAATAKKRGAAMLVVAAGVEEYNMRKKKRVAIFIFFREKSSQGGAQRNELRGGSTHTHTKCATITSCVLLFFETRKKTNAFLTLSRILYVSRGNRKNKRERESGEPYGCVR
jgi:hypothetical protein